MGPAVSCVWDMGIIPLLDTRPTVGFMPTMQLFLEGEIIEPLVSVPMQAAAKEQAAATPDPDELPDGQGAGPWSLVDVIRLPK